MSRATGFRARHRTLSACISSFFAVTAPGAALADSWTVTSCTDNAATGNAIAKTGTLRFALANASSPATIDLSGLTGGACPSATLTLDAVNGELSTSLVSVTLQGPGAGALTIDASALGIGEIGDYRVIKSTGQLTISGLSLSGGRVYHSNFQSSGGCVYAGGDLLLSASIVTDCHAEAGGVSSYAPAGGAVYGRAAVTLANSSVTNSLAGAQGADVTGGGVFALGTLTLLSSSVQYNSAISNTHDAKGGNLFAAGTVSITDSTVAHGAAMSATGLAKGGGLYAGVNDASLVQSFVTFNHATGKGTGSGGGIYAAGNLGFNRVFLGDNSVDAPLGTSRGGGATVIGNFQAQYSTISGNDSLHGSGGGMRLRGNLSTIHSSTISANTAVSFGGLEVYVANVAGSVFELANSTVSGNSSQFSAGALYADAANVRMYNTTVADNHAGEGFNPGVILAPPAFGMSFVLQSSLIATNSDGILDTDLFVTDPAKLTVNAGNLAAPANNLVRFASPSVLAKLPADTKTATVNDDACPHLQALRDNGGLAWTHRPMSDSPALDAGNNLKNYATDQRGTAATNGDRTYARVSGAQADIGAHEVEVDDVVFATDIEGCNSLP